MLTQKINAITLSSIKNILGYRLKFVARCKKISQSSPQLSARSTVVYFLAPMPGAMRGSVLGLVYAMSLGLCLSAAWYSTVRAQV